MSSNNKCQDKITMHCCNAIESSIINLNVWQKAIIHSKDTLPSTCPWTPAYPIVYSLSMTMIFETYIHAMPGQQML